ncbi:hypothetical protein PCC8801_3464 [Rippkaea orientalis PCC 8801]|uniref:Uncharacterized protein n=1 Tax=Rippkaea orientalis (strain PCC 8801 / RF-1) TaxID=41431 RepID=B7K0E6_RIPO1|nr:helix-turn-helix domain-containing protein [Rippkaea orientalis]ACK67430.1 hypothetical protein PCC8801_3464 [Rippkaea orientalis PCC 8801]
MPRRIEIVSHLSITELQTKYRSAKNPVTRSQYQIIWLLASGKKTEEVAIATGYTVEWVRELARRYNRSFETIEELEEVLIPRLKVLMEQPEFVSGLTCFHWWPTTDTCIN